MSDVAREEDGLGFFRDDDVKSVRLRDWLNWASGNSPDVFLALPMIQRNFVWKPQQIIELWDSLLQGMPIGSMMATELPPDTFVRKPGKHEIERVPAGGGLGLIDGQQRTLAMLAAWPLLGQVKNRDLRVWVDFADDPASGHLLRLRVTTKNQPFGFRRNEPSSKLSLDERRKAREAFDALAEARGPQTTADENRVNPDIDTAWPFSPTPGLSVDLRFLIGKWHEISCSSPWAVAIGEYLQGIDGVKYVDDRSTGKWQQEGDSPRQTPRLCGRHSPLDGRE